MNAGMQKRLGIILYCISIGILILAFGLSFNISVWKDEVVTLRIIREPYSFFLLTNREAAPIGHLTILKFFVDTFARILPDVHYLYIAKITSVIPFVLLVVLSFTKIRKRFGLLTSAIFAFLIATMPKMLGISIEIRQYAWALFFTTVCYIYFYEFLYESKKKSAWICLISGILAAGTHYFGCFAVAMFYMVALLYFWKMRDKKGASFILLLIAASCVLFSPWLFIAGEQIINMAEHFWIPPITFTDIPGFLSYFFITDTNKFNVGVFSVIVFYIILFFFWKDLWNKDKNKRRLYIVLGLVVPYFILAIGVVIGLFIWPVFQARYIFPSLGCFWLAFAIMLGRQCNNKKLFSTIMFFLLLVGMLNVFKVTKDEIKYGKEAEATVSFLESLSEGDVVLTDDARLRDCFSLYAEKDVWIWDETLIKVDDVRQWQESGRKIYFFDSDHVTEKEASFFEYCENEGIELSHMGEYGMEYVHSELFFIENQK